MLRCALLAGVAAVVLAGCSSAAPPPAAAAPSARLAQSPTPSASPTPTVPLTPQQKYVNDINSQFPDYASGVPDTKNPNVTGTAAGLLDEGAQICEALATGGEKAAAYSISENFSPGSEPASEDNAIAALTQADLCPVPGKYQSKYQDYVNALKAAHVYRLVADGPESLGDPAAFANLQVCGNGGIGPDWEQAVNMTQAEANTITRLTDKYLCPGQKASAIVETVTFMATGSNILYGPAGSENAGTSGMKVTQQISLGSPPLYYAITAFGGSCKLVVNSDGLTTTSQASASSGLAHCEVVDVDGTWYDANSS